MRLRRNAIVSSCACRACALGKLLLRATCRLRRASPAASGSGSDSSPAFSSCQTYWLWLVHSESAPCCSDRLSRQAPGLGPGALLPLATISRLPSALTLTAFGDQPVGVRPTTRLSVARLSPATTPSSSLSRAVAASSPPHIAAAF